MADQTQRLEIATVRAEVGSNIVFRFAHDAVNADSIPTQTGDIQNLKQVVLEIQQDAAEKISISTTIYPTVAAGLAATADQGIFLVQSNDADEIYTVWQNQGGTAVNTGKTALSATAIQEALQASSEAAQAAEDAADTATARTAGFLAPSNTDPAVRDNGMPLQAGDRYFNITQQAERIYTDDGWVANESQQAIADLRQEISETPGPNRIPRSRANGEIDHDWLPEDIRSAAESAERSISKDFPLNASMYFRSKVIELGFRDSHYDYLVSQYGYSYIYPQQFCIDSESSEVFVLKSVSGGENNFAWIWVYDLSNGAIKSVFSTGERWYESLVLRHVGSDRYLYTIGESGNPIRLLVNELPVNYTIVSPTNRYTTVPGYSIMAFDGDNWYVQESSGYLGQSRRNRFLVYDSEFSALRGRVIFNLADFGTISPSYIDFFPKLQTLAFHDGALYGGFGGAYSPSLDISMRNAPSRMAGIAAFLPTGEKIESALCQPDRFISVMSNLTGYQNTLCENEGVASSGEHLYSLWVTLSPSERISPDYSGKGVVICREIAKSADRADFRYSASSSRAPFSVEKFCATVHASSSQLQNPVTFESLTNFQQIVQMMQDLALHRYAFYGANQTVTDIFGSAVSMPSSLVEFINVGGNTYTVSITGFGNYAVRYIIGGAGSTQNGPYSNGEEIGSNSNGWFVKHASGLLECFFLKADGLTCTTSAGAVFRNDASWTWTFPAEFVLGGPTPCVTGNPCYGNRWWGGTTGQPSRSTCNPVIFSTASDSVSRPLTLEAKGRWRL